MNKKYLIVLVLVFFAKASFAQFSETMPSSTKMNYSLEMGTIIGKGNSTFMNSYISPSFAYQVNPRLQIRLGMTLVNYTGKTLNSSEYTGLTDFRREQMYFYAQSEYKVNEKLKISGEILRSSPGKFNSGIQINPLNVYSFGAEYKFNEAFSIGIQVRKVEGARNSFYNPAFQSPMGY